jgi:endonuclease III
MPVTTRTNLLNRRDFTPKLSRENIRVVSPDVARSSIRLMCEANDDSPTFRNNNDETTNVIQESIEDSNTVSISTSSKSLSKRKKISKDNNTVTLTPKSKKHQRNSAVEVTPIETVQSGEQPTQLKNISCLKTINPPKDWIEVYSLVKELREDRTAPCDHSGCEALPDKNVDPITRRFQVLICLMLSSQTKDAVVGAAIRSMQKDNVLNINSVHQMDAAILQQYINKVGFHNNKTKYIKESVQILIDKYNGDIPQTATEMIRDLPGVGPKMAYIIESVAWDTQSGIGVDTHMHRLFNLLHWVHNTTNPEKTRIQLEAWLPKCYWSEINLLWVGFGQEIQQEKPKILQKALHCSRPKEVLLLLKRCGLDYRKVGKELNIMDKIEQVLLSD